MNIRIGLGTDRHRLQEGLPLMLGGLAIPSDKGSLGHSDGDVLIHAICDALLGALAMRDIGFHFPDNDPVYKGAPSRIFLEHVMKLLREAGWEVINVDSTIHLESPRLSPHIDGIRQSLAEMMMIGSHQISVKAKTGEKTGAIGTGEVVEALAVCLLGKSPDQA
ncbi:MAG: 2-C-methyl-D-erythritol 2,4-cyclodiphosphate synthase [Bacteroidales bacterium]